jgi:hypothetical protein
MHITTKSSKYASLLLTPHDSRALLQDLLHLVLPFVMNVRAWPMDPGESVLILLIMRPRPKKVLGNPKLTIRVCHEEASLLLDLFEMWGFAELAIEPA